MVSAMPRLKKLDFDGLGQISLGQKNKKIRGSTAACLGEGEYIT